MNSQRELCPYPETKTETSSFFFLSCAFLSWVSFLYSKSPSVQGGSSGAQFHTLATFPKQSPEIRRFLRASASFSTHLALWVCFPTLFDASESYFSFLSSSNIHLKSGLFLLQAAFWPCCSRISGGQIYCKKWEICKNL